MSAPSEQKYVTVARILRARGNKGEVATELLTDFPDRLKQIHELHLAPESAPPVAAGLLIQGPLSPSGQVGSFSPRQVALRSFWLDRNHPGQAVFHFEGVDSISDAEKLRGLLVQIPFEHRVTLPAGTYFVTDLIGCAVFEISPTGVSEDLNVAPRPSARQLPYASSPCSLSEAPWLLGKVRDVFFPGEGQPGTPLLAIDTQQDELLVPLAEDICKRVDTAARRIEVQLPEGLRDLNA